VKKLCQLRLDLHVHTVFSGDSINDLDDIIRYVKLRKLDGIAITDHNTVEGALSFQKAINKIIVIPGIEVSTSKGHILGLNVTEVIPKGLDPVETVDLIHEAGGIAVMAHPFAIHKHSLRENPISSKLKLDAIEVINSSVFPFYPLHLLSKRLASKLRLPQTGGSDSHFPETIGLAYTLINAQPRIDNIILAIKKGRTEAKGRPIPITLRFKQLTKNSRAKSFRAGKVQGQR